MEETVMMTLNRQFLGLFFIGLSLFACQPVDSVDPNKINKTAKAVPNNGPGEPLIDLDHFPKTAKNGRFTYPTHRSDTLPDDKGEYQFGHLDVEGDGEALETLTPSNGTWENIKQASIVIINNISSMNYSLEEFYREGLPRGENNDFKAPDKKIHLLYSLNDKQWIVFRIISAKISKANGVKQLVFKITKVNSRDGVILNIPSGKKEAEEQNIRPGFAFEKTSHRITPRIVVDLTIGYSNNVEDLKGGGDAAIAFINQAVSYANRSLKNSHAGVKLQVYELIRAETEPVGPLDALTSLKAARRETYDANNPYHIVYDKWIKSKSDLLAFFTKDYDGDLSEGAVCGVAYFFYKSYTPRQYYPYAFNANSAKCPIFVLAHEVGHNFSCAHDTATDGESNNPDVYLPYAVGFRTKYEQVEEG